MVTSIEYAAQGCTIWIQDLGGGGAKYGCGRMYVCRVSGFLHNYELPCPFYHLLKTLYASI